MISLPSPYQALEAEIKAGTITGEEALARFKEVRTSLGAPWHWKEWRTARDAKIGTCCEQCGVGEGSIMVLQHTKPLPALADAVEEAKYASDFVHEIRAVRERITMEEEPELRDACPVCSSPTVYYRKAFGNWTCAAKKKFRVCGAVFDTPVKLPIHTPNQKRLISERKYEAWVELKAKWRGQWLSQGLLMWFERMREYLSLEYTKTLCKRCAFMEDKTSYRPCPDCGFGIYKNSQHCPNCAEPSDEAPRLWVNDET